MKVETLLEYYKCPLHRYTFEIKDMRVFAEENSVGKTLNLFAGRTRLNIDEVRNDLDKETNPDFNLEALDCVHQWDKPEFDTIILDPPYSYRKSMEMYGGRKASKFKMIKDHIPSILRERGRVITYGYHSVSMGTKRGFRPYKVAIFSHGGAIHDTIATIEELVGSK